MHYLHFHIKLLPTQRDGSRLIDEGDRLQSSLNCISCCKLPVFLTLDACVMKEVLLAALLGVEDCEVGSFWDELAAEGAEGVSLCKISRVLFLCEGKRDLLWRLLERLVVVGVSIRVEGTVSFFGLCLSSMVGDVVPLARCVQQIQKSGLKHYQ